MILNIFFKEMKKTLALFAVVLSVCLTAAGQSGTDAETLLSEAAAAIKKEKSYKAAFTYLMSGESASRSGVLYVSGEKYRLTMDFLDRIYDGRRTYNIMPDEKEVGIEEASTATAGNSLGSISDILNTFARDFTVSSGERKGAVRYLRLTPKDTRSATEYVLVGIDSATKMLVDVYEKSRSGGGTYLKVTGIDRGCKTDAAMFTFDREKYKKEGYYIAEP